MNIKRAILIYISLINLSYAQDIDVVNILDNIKLYHWNYYDFNKFVCRMTDGNNKAKINKISSVTLEHTKDTLYSLVYNNDGNLSCFKDCELNDVWYLLYDRDKLVDLKLNNALRFIFRYTYNQHLEKVIILTNNVDSAYSDTITVNRKLLNKNTEIYNYVFGNYVYKISKQTFNNGKCESKTYSGKQLLRTSISLNNELVYEKSQKQIDGRKISYSKILKNKNKKRVSYEVQSFFESSFNKHYSTFVYHKSIIDSQQHFSLDYSSTNSFCPKKDNTRQIKKFKISGITKFNNLFMPTFTVRKPNANCLVNSIPDFEYISNNKEKVYLINFRYTFLN